MTKISQRRVCPAEGNAIAEALSLTVLSLSEKHQGGQMAAGWWEQMNRRMVGGEIREVVGG